MTRRCHRWLVTVGAWLSLTSPVVAQPTVFTVASGVTIQPTVRLFGDAHGTTPAPGATDDAFDLRRRRVGVQLSVRRRVDIQVEHELASANPWRDAFADVRAMPAVRVRAGKFKMPFSLDQLTGAGDRDLIYRARIGGLLAPGRSIGAAVHGRFAKRSVGYEVGWFSRDGDIARFGSNPGAGQTTAGRVTVRPLRAAGVTGDAGNLELAVNATVGTVPEGLHSLRGRLASSDVFFTPVFVNGRRLRRGADVSWSPGRLSLRAEVVRVDDERVGQGFRGETLPLLTSDGWYVAGAWRVAGRRPKAVPDSRPTSRFGRVDVAARLEGMAVHTAASGQPAQRQPRATHLMTQSVQGWTLGGTWHVTAWIRIQANVIRETLSDTQRSPVIGRSDFWTRAVRLQFLL